MSSVSGCFLNYIFHFTNYNCHFTNYKITIAKIKQEGGERSLRYIKDADKRRNHLSCSFKNENILRLFSEEPKQQIQDDAARSDCIANIKVMSCFRSLNPSFAVNFNLLISKLLGKAAFVPLISIQQHFWEFTFRPNIQTSKVICWCGNCIQI